MAKKTKAVKPLPSALTVARSAPLTSHTLSAKAKSVEAEALKPPARTPKPHPPLTLEGTSAKPSVPLARAPSSPKAAIREQTPTPTASQAVRVTFTLVEPDANQVALCGDFNGWACDATPMKWHDGGQWERTVALAPGRYEYKILVDGQWTHDPLARENVWNPHGTLNSVIEVRA